MSFKWISPEFASGMLDASGEWDFGDLSPEDIVLHVVFHRLRSDPKLQALFGSRFSLTWTRPFSIQAGPMLWVYNADQRDEDRRPTDIATLRIPIACAVMHEAEPNSFAPMLGYNDTLSPPYELEAGMSSLVHYIKQKFRAGRQLKVVRADNGLEVHIATTSEVGANSGFPAIDEQANRRVWIHEIEWVWEVNIDNSEGKINNLL